MRTLLLAVAVSAGLVLAASVTTASHAGSTATPSGGSAGVAVSPTTQTSLSVQATGTTITSASLNAWCYSSSAWGRLPALDLELTTGGPRVAGRPAESSSFLVSQQLLIPPGCSRLYWQTLDVRPAGLSHTIEVSLMSTPGASACDNIIIRAESCGTTAASLPTSRTASSTSLEITNSAENAGSPKVKCVVDPADGGVGFGGTNPGLVRSPGESMYFGIDDTHTVVCVCDTPATAVTTTECVP